MDAALRRNSMALIGGQYEVSILVLMDAALRPGLGELLQKRLVVFQSLF